MKDEEIHCMSVLTELWTLTRASRQRERAERRPPGQRWYSKQKVLIQEWNPEEFRKSVSGVQRATDPSALYLIADDH
ncbi:hypothetical protein EVAR_102020_1 [Eumeta japonica]|uniref:Uncharacterized protein n=1 Tax=Eumeta variegata TaxID=151549 RepID=A0A4C1TZI6_EUMVA|nr:hypothetical protein EVAR_102020_1 [Eumeta japonica]